jgi:flagellin-like hook-associated protein FlgL
MRITQKAIALTSLQGLNRNLDAVGKLQEQLTSGRKINKPADSPTGTNRAMQTRSDQAATDQYQRNITDAKSWMEQSDTVLQTMINQARRVRDLTVQGINTGSQSAASQQALATEVSSLRESLLALANTSSAGRPLFGGTTSGPAAYDAGGNWVGRGGTPVERRISDTERVRIDLIGPEAFGPAGGNDLFKVVNDIATDLTANPTALSGHLTDLDSVMNGMLTAVASIGARSARIERAESVISDRVLTLQSQLASTENVDLPSTIMNLQMQQTGYQAALSATAKSLTPTLVDFLS